jgi:hypothetical protein
MPRFPIEAHYMIRILARDRSLGIPTVVEIHIYLRE